MGDRSSINSSFLTPPLTPRNEHDVPYRPPETDRISLSMKKRKGKDESKTGTKHDKQNQSKWADLERFRINNPRTLLQDHSDRRSSLSVLHTAFPDGSDFQQDQSAEQKARRWTLPSKSAPTSVLTPLRSKVKQATLTTRPESPAMITLRRATTNRKPKKIELTFFPAPKFGNEKSGLLSYIVSTFSRSEMLGAASQSRANTSTRLRSVRSASVESDGAHPTWTFPAATVCTETFVEPSLAMPGTSVSNPSSRRCSTKYVTGDSSYEIIWDENDNSNTARQSSRPSPTFDRRPSLAATKLEAQLAQNLQNTRRSSAASGESSSTNSRSSVNMFLEQVITPERLSSLFPRLLRDTAFRNLPRSRAGARECKSVSNMAEVEPAYQAKIDDSQRSRTPDFDWFPSLQRCQTSNGNNQNLSKVASATMPDSQPSRRVSTSQGPPKSRLGSMVGSSSHTRRRSSATAKIRRQRGQKNKNRHSMTDGKGVGQQIDDEDMTPLLCSQPRHQTSRG